MEAFLIFNFKTKCKYKGLKSTIGLVLGFAETRLEKGIHSLELCLLHLKVIAKVSYKSQTTPDVGGQDTKESNWRRLILILRFSYTFCGLIRHFQWKSYSGNIRDGMNTIQNRIFLDSLPFNHEASKNYVHY